MNTKDNTPSPLAVLAAAATPPRPERTKLTKAEHYEICRLNDLGKSVTEIVKITRRSPRAIWRFLEKRKSSKAYAATHLDMSLGDIAERVVEECNVTEGMELLNRAGVAGFVKREKTVVNAAVITIAQADVPSQDVIDAEEVRLENVRAGIVKAPVLAVPSVATADVPE